MATTYEAIATVTVGSGGATDITFSSIPGTYTDLLILLSGRSTSTTNNWTGVLVELNGTTTNIGAGIELYGTGSASGSGATGREVALITTANATASTFGNSFIYFPNYASSNNKTISGDTVTENNATSSLVDLLVNKWFNSSAITSIKLSPAAGNFVQYSTATLYGIKNS